MDIERRGLDIQVRTEQGGRRVRWYPIMFDSLSSDLGGFREKIGRRALTKTMQESNVTADWQHSQDIILGTTKAGTLRLVADQRGLEAEVDLPESAALVRELTARGDVTAGSFSFSAVKERWETGTPPVRILDEIRLYSVSLLASAPAYPATLNTVSTRAQAEARSLALPDASRLLRVARGEHKSTAELRRELDEMAGRLGVSPEPPRTQPRRRFWHL